MDALADLSELVGDADSDEADVLTDGGLTDGDNGEEMIDALADLGDSGAEDLLGEPDSSSEPDVDMDNEDASNIGARAPRSVSRSCSVVSPNSSVVASRFPAFGPYPFRAIHLRSA